MLALSACTGPAYDTTPPFSGDPPAVYVAKVKTILVGLPPTADEIAAVTKDETALPGLITQWMALPQYQQKMQVFFQLAFQQTQITDVNFADVSPTGGLGNGAQVPLLVQNATESFARTVVAMTATDAPLTNAFTTTQVMMTPALMQLYAYLDTHVANDDASINDTFARANKNLEMIIEQGQGPIPIEEAIGSGSNFMHFYNPELLEVKYPQQEQACDGQDDIQVKANAFQLFQLLYGVIPAHPGPGGINCPIRGSGKASSYLLPTDFTSWKLVTVRAPVGTEATTLFYDLPTLRTTSELVLNTPHPGFFSTPAFEANWPTNQSNQMRVTVNQALIVATGNQVDGTDGTVPPSTPGLDAQHAAPGTACYGCHQLLDPTRSILSKTYSWFYDPQIDPALLAQPGMFAFQGVVQPMQTIDDFARLLATHPLVPAAWAQKLCYYVNSAPCDPNDPEFQRIVADFGKSFSWNTLVAELLASPITTGAADSATRATHGEVIAVTRRDHLCAALNNRLGFVDICQLDAADQTGSASTIAQIISGMPSDGYGRGATIPVLPNQPTLFYRGGAENICAAVSAEVIDATPDPLQPGAKQWQSSQAPAAIAEMVSLVMGLTAGDARTAPATAALTAHFTAATQMGATPTDALRSTFVAACLSPSFIGIGM